MPEGTCNLKFSCEEYVFLRAYFSWGLLDKIVEKPLDRVKQKRLLGRK